jgi:hypothetical protein
LAAMPAAVPAAGEPPGAAKKVVTSFIKGENAGRLQLAIIRYRHAII